MNEPVGAPPSAAEAALRGWHPDPRWASAVAPAIRTLMTDGRHVGSWATLAMMLGDVRAPALCFLVCLHARALERTAAEDARLSAHQALAAWDLGLGAPDPSGTVQPDGARVEAWQQKELAPFDGRLERAAAFCLCLAGARTGLLRGPPDPGLAGYCDLGLFRLADEAAG